MLKPLTQVNTAHPSIHHFVSELNFKFVILIHIIVGAIDKLEGFASIHGAAFYGLQPNTKTITLIKEQWNVQDHYDFECTDVSNEESKRVRPLRAGETIAWKLQ